MCVLAFALDVDNRWPLVLLANRDERHDRLSAPVQRWPDAPSITAGRDLVGGGTWLGVSDGGRLAAITNVRMPGGPQEGRPTRGGLVQSLLLGEPPLLDDLAAYNPFNLLQIELGGARVWTNTPAPQETRLGSGVHSLSNGPHLEKTPRALRLEQGLVQGLERAAEDDDLFALLSDEDAAVGPPTFLRNPVYGTRCSTLVRIGVNGASEIVERRFDALGAPTGKTRLAFAWQV